MWSFWQDLSQLRLLYPQDWPTMLNNAAVIQAFGLNNYQMAREWSDVLGTAPEALLRLEPEEMVLGLQRQGALTCRRLDYLCDELFAFLYEPNERYALLAETERFGEQQR